MSESNPHFPTHPNSSKDRRAFDPDRQSDPACEVNTDWLETKDERPRGKDAFGTSYLGDAATQEPWQRWRQIQASFVDDPRSAVSEAHGLVDELVDQIVHQFEAQRHQLEQRWSGGEDVSTEDLRRSLQRYRDFFGRLLTNVGDLQA